MRTDKDSHGHLYVVILDGTRLEIHLRMMTWFGKHYFIHMDKRPNKGQGKYLHEYNTYTQGKYIWVF